MTAYLSLGSNIGDRVANLRACVAHLGSVGQVTKKSSFYETEPMELREQPWFVNCVVKRVHSTVVDNSGKTRVCSGIGRPRV
ncbi:MAG: hypothetical protein DMG61_09650 [Acidobacteria bacterium]|nr:MAG: hypothetical protein DMG61_09650 [Acidobacteriota bacterium]